MEVVVTAKAKRRQIMPTDDLGYKYLFGNDEHKEVLWGLLTDFAGVEASVDDLVIEEPYSIHLFDLVPVEERGGLSERTYSTLKQTLRDVTCSIPAADLTIEMQKLETDWFDQRMLYYQVDRYASRFRRAGGGRDGYRALKPVYGLSFLGYRRTACEHGIHWYVPTDTLWGEGETLGWLQTGVIELTKTKFATENQRFWVEFMNTGVAPEGAPWYIVKAAKIVQSWRLTREERAMVDLMEKAMETYELEMSFAIRKAREEERAEMVRQALAVGVPAATVAKFSGFSEAELEALSGQ
jgi:hypothetical protein